MQKNAEAIKKEIKKIDEAIRELENRYKIVGELDQKGDLIVGEQETWSEAVERRDKESELLAKRSELEKSLTETQS